MRVTRKGSKRRGSVPFCASTASCGTGLREACGVEALKVFDFRDGPGNDPWQFRLAVKTIAEFIRKFPNLLVHCHAGRSRSVVVVAGHLMAHEKWSQAEAITFISRRREIALTPGITNLLHESDEPLF